MGLDSYKSDDSSSSNSSSSGSSSSNNRANNSSSGGGSTAEDDTSIDETELTFYDNDSGQTGKRPMERKGAMSDLSTGDLVSKTEGEIGFGQDELKLHLPIFTIITADGKYEPNTLYQLSYPHDPPRPSWNNKVVICISSTETALGSVNKEVAMFEAGSTSKKRVMDRFDSRFGPNLDSNTKVSVNVFADAQMLRDLAQANEEMRSGDLVNRDKVMTKVLNAEQLRVHLED